MVKSEKIYSPQSFLELVTGKCYIINGVNDIETIEFLLDDYSYSFRNYSLSEINIIVKNNVDVVLVDCSIWNDDTCEFDHEYRWFEIPDDTKF